MRPSVACPAGDKPRLRFARCGPAYEGHYSGDTALDYCPLFSYKKPRISPTSGTSTGDSRWMGRVRYLRAGLVTPLSGGLGIGPSGITTGVRGAPLKRDPKAKVTPSHFIARSTAWAESTRSVAATRAAAKRRKASGLR